MVSEVVPAKVANVFKDAKQLAEQVDSVIKQFQVKIFFGGLSHGRFVLVYVVSFCHLIPSAVDSSDLLVEVVRMDDFSDKILVGSKNILMEP